MDCREGQPFAFSVADCCRRAFISRGYGKGGGGLERAGGGGAVVTLGEAQSLCFPASLRRLVRMLRRRLAGWVKPRGTQGNAEGFLCSGGLYMFGKRGAGAPLQRCSQGLFQLQGAQGTQRRG